jgi:hypothetical protein
MLDSVPVSVSMITTSTTLPLSSDRRDANVDARPAIFNEVSARSRRSSQSRRFSREAMMATWIMTLA